MPGINFIVNNSLEIAVDLPLGKPDKQAPYVAIGKDNHRRLVKQEGAKSSSTTWYYVLNILRDRIGKNPSEEFKADREIEIKFSSYRKSMEHLDKEYSSYLTLMKSISGDQASIKQLSDQLSQDIIQGDYTIIKKIFAQSNSTFDDGVLYRFTRLLLSKFEIFLSQSQKKNFSDFLIDECCKKKMTEGYKLLSGFGVSLEKEVSKYIALNWSYRRR